MAFCERAWQLQWLTFEIPASLFRLQSLSLNSIATVVCVGNSWLSCFCPFVQSPATRLWWIAGASNHIWGQPSPRLQPTSNSSSHRPRARRHRHYPWQVLRTCRRFTAITSTSRCNCTGIRLRLMESSRDDVTGSIDYLLGLLALFISTLDSGNLVSGAYPTGN